LNIAENQDGSYFITSENLPLIPTMTASLPSMTLREVSLHPSNHHPSQLATTAFDVVVVGAGPVGNTAAARLSKAGLSVLVVEEELYGGDCPYWACVPSKALLRPIEALDAARGVSGAREAIGNLGKAEVDVEAVFRRRDMFVRNWNDGFLLGLAENNGVTPVRGRGRIAGEKKITIEPFGEKKLYEVDARHAVILATGSTPIIPKISGLEDLKMGEMIWTPREATASSFAPEHLIVIGGGVVGCEMATAYSKLGSKVTVVCRSSEILQRCEPEAAKMVRDNLAAHGVSFELHSNPVKIKRVGPSKVEMTLSNGNVLTGTHVLVAVGRVPRTEDLGLETIALLNTTNIEVDDTLAVKTGNDTWLYAVGDANNRALLTHMGNYQARIVSNVIISKLPDLIKDKQILNRRRQLKSVAEPSVVPQVIVTLPSIATVGPTLTDAKNAGRDVYEVSIPFAFPGAILYGDYPGWARWIIEKGTDRLIGATYCCNEASDLVHAATVAIIGGQTLGSLCHSVPSFPTRSEVYRFLLDAAGY
jgi:pyruvate/2-oxoglutarate dehydrogenase complex dihydrolipoamide dehydrogenase (E3) component